MTNEQLGAPDPEQRPLVTFAMFAYNQERFIREAVEGALAQTYSPLQIILSDDCSSDRTFEIMKELVSKYSGHNDILLNRNERNLGIGGHVNRIMSLARGQYIIAAAGDDISIPSRSEEVCKVFLGNKKCKGIYTPLIKIDEFGALLGEYRRQNTSTRATLASSLQKYFPGTLGASHAWSREIFDFFGPIHPGIVCEDRVLPLREILLGEIVELDRPLVKYRVHTAGISQVKSDQSLEVFSNYQRKMWKQTLASLVCYRKDLQLFCRRHTHPGEPDLVIVTNSIRPMSRCANLMRVFYTKKNKLGRLSIILRLFVLKRDIREFARLLTILFLPKFYLWKIRKERR